MLRSLVLIPVACVRLGTLGWLLALLRLGRTAAESACDHTEQAAGCFGLLLGSMAGRVGKQTGPGRGLMDAVLPG